MPKFTPIDHDLEQLQRYPAIIGCDEVGRGCLAGPIMACTVRIDLTTLPFLKDRVADSKKLNPVQRRTAYDQIVGRIPHIVTDRTSQQVDAHGIQPCNKDIFRQGIESLVKEGDLVLVDGTLPKLHPHMLSLKKGESVSVAIAAASIIAKVTRDRLMDQFEDNYPGYSFREHKGYGTRAHVAALRALGPCAIHRRSFIKNIWPTAA